MEYSMSYRFVLLILLVFGEVAPVHGQEQQTVPEQVYPALEYVLSLSQSSAEINPEKLSDLITFMRSVPVETSMALQERQGASGAFHAFSIRGNLSNLLDYAYNPDIPIYVTMPSSLQNHEWLTPEVTDELRNLPRSVGSANDIRLVRGRDYETITPDTNTGGYYVYTQDRLVTILPGATGPVLISVSRQGDPSEVGKKGCVVGDDKNWNYLYSGETGLNKTGLGWVDSYMYYADSVIIYIADSSANVLRVGSFKWLNAGWAKINMVKSSHILNGMKRFASDFKAVLESPGLPEARVLEGKYKELLLFSEQDLRQMVAPYLQALSDTGVLDACSKIFRSMVSSGKYLQQMSHGEMVRVLLLEYIKGYVGREPLGRIASQRMPTETFASQP